MEAALLPAEGSEVEGSISPGPTPSQMQDGAIPPEYCSFRGEGQLFHILVTIANSSALSRQGVGPTLLHCPGSGWAQLCTVLGHQHCPRWWPRPGTCIHLVFGGNRPLLLQDPRPRHGPWQQHGPEHHHGLSSGCSLGVPPLPHISSSASLHSAQTNPLLFLACLSPTY